MPAMDPTLLVLPVAGLLGGLALLARGFGGYRTATRIGDIGTSSISSMAAGEVRVSGTIVAGEVTLLSPLQRRDCVYYQARIDGDDDGSPVPDLHEERAVGFRVRDATGEVRIFPRGARWDAPMRFDERTGTFGEEPSGLALRSGAAFGRWEDPTDRQAAIDRLLTVRPAAPASYPEAAGASASVLLGGLTAGLGDGRRGRRYVERRLEVGDAVTVVGRAMPFADLADPAEADHAIGADVSADDPEIHADLAEARAAGLLAATPEAAWGNAAIPGFGIDRPQREPALDPAATAPALAPADEGARTAARFTIEPETLVIAAAPDVSLLVAHGIPDAAVDRHQDRFLLGLMGAVLAIGSAVALALVVGGAVVP